MVCNFKAKGGHDLAHALLVHFAGVVAKDHIHLFEGLVPSLGNEEEHPQEHEKTEGAEEDVGAEFELVQHVGCDLADHEIHHIVARDDYADCLTAVTRREDLGCKKPSDRAPGVGEVGSEDLAETSLVRVHTLLRGKSDWYDSPR